jgi:hypothetical protein
MPQGNDDNHKVFDVSKPHKITPSASSRPIIVGHHPIMADPMVLEERYRHPKPPDPPSDEKPETQAPPTPVIQENPAQRMSITPPSQSQTPAEPAVEKAYTTYSSPEQQSEQAVGQSLEELPQSPPEPKPTADNPSGMDQLSTNMELPVSPQQPVPENPLHVPAGAASKENDKNQIGLAIILLIIIALAAGLAIQFLSK